MGTETAGVVGEAALRERVASLHTPVAIRRDRVWAGAALASWSVCLAALAASGRATPSVWLVGGVSLVGWLVNFVRAMRKRVATAEGLPVEVVTRARQGARSCPRCGGVVFVWEWRCPACRSIRHQFGAAAQGMGLDQWVPLVAVILLVATLLLALVSTLWRA